MTAGTAQDKDEWQVEPSTRPPLYDHTTYGAVPYQTASFQVFANGKFLASGSEVKKIDGEASIFSYHNPSGWINRRHRQSTSVLHMEKSDIDAEYDVGTIRHLTFRDRQGPSHDAMDGLWRVVSRQEKHGQFEGSVSIAFEMRHQSDRHRWSLPLSRRCPCGGSRLGFRSWLSRLFRIAPCAFTIGHTDGAVRIYSVVMWDNERQMFIECACGRWSRADDWNGQGVEVEFASSKAADDYARRLRLGLPQNDIIFVIVGSIPGIVGLVLAITQSG